MGLNTKAQKAQYRKHTQQKEENFSSDPRVSFIPPKIQFWPSKRYTFGNNNHGFYKPKCQEITVYRNHGILIKHYDNEISM
jgi:hypothetical protein